MLFHWKKIGPPASCIFMKTRLSTVRMECKVLWLPTMTKTNTFVIGLGSVCKYNLSLFRNRNKYNSIILWPFHVYDFSVLFDTTLTRYVCVNNIHAYVTLCALTEIHVLLK